jgi:hypothetical protein
LSKPLWALWAGGAAAHREATVHIVHRGGKPMAVLAMTR